MTHLRSVLVALVGAASLVVGGAAVGSADDQPLVSFDSMTPVTGSAVGTVNDRGIVGGGKPWVISAASGEVSDTGSVHVTVTGLVIPVAPFNGTNPVGAFGVTVSCVTPNGIVNVRTGTAPATKTGNATIDGTVTLPHPCNDPIVFVTSPTGAWFAMSNDQGNEDDNSQ